jgi:hypothetical protein
LCLVSETRRNSKVTVIPAQAGIQQKQKRFSQNILKKIPIFEKRWIPACAGMTEKKYAVFAFPFHAVARF